MEEFVKQKELLEVLAEEDEALEDHRSRQGQRPPPHQLYNTENTDRLIKVVSSVLLVCLLINTFFNIDVSYFAGFVLIIMFFLFSFKGEIQTGLIFLYENSLKEMIEKLFSKKSKDKIECKPV